MPPSSPGSPARTAPGTASSARDGPHSKRLRILEAARHVCAREGYEAATMEAVAAEARVSKGTLYNYVESKEHLFLATLSRMVDQGVSIRLIHAKEPGPAFRDDYDRYPNLIEGMEMLLCPRAHFKILIADGRIAYTGSANLTGAGMGAKSDRRRNFETGILTDEPALVQPLMAQFDALWNGSRCEPCQRKTHCATYQELIG